MQEKKKVFLTLVVVLLVEGVQSSYYSNDNCPICYDPAANVPPECEGLTSEEIAAKTKACVRGVEYCMKWTFAEGESVPSHLGNQLLHEEDNAKYWCANPQVQSTYSEMGGKLRVNIEDPTEPPSGASSTQQGGTTMPLITEKDEEATEKDEEAEEKEEEATEKDEEAGPTTDESPSDEDDNTEEAPVRGCQVGMELQGQNCVDCELNSYKGEDDEECVQCPDGKVTNGVASTSVDDCIQACGPGYYLKKDMCKFCKPNTYSDQPHNAACTPCPEGTNNEDSDQDSESTCVKVVCDPGNYFDAAGRFCHACAKNTYRSEEDHQIEECKPCPDGTKSESGALKCVPIEEGNNNTNETTVDNPNGGSMAVFLSSILMCFTPILVL